MKIEGYTQSYYIYGIFDNESCLYVGATRDPVNRAKSHGKRFSYSAVMRILHTTTDIVEAERLERFEIQSRKGTTCNRQENSGYAGKSFSERDGRDQGLALLKAFAEGHRPKEKREIRILTRMLDQFGLFDDPRDVAEWLKGNAIKAKTDPLDDPMFN
jgi:hypothetical protein